MIDLRRLEAARWADRIADDGGRRRSRRFEAWMADPDNAAAFDVIVAARSSSAALAGEAELLALRHEAVARTSLRRSRLSPSLWVPMAASLAIVAPLALWHVDRVPRTMPAASEGEPVYRTGIGQKLAMTLEDGSRVTLDTDSRLRVAYSATERRLVLDRGQAMFEVAKHRARPFVVAAGDQTVTAHGTAFDVRISEDQVRVVLVEGKVSVASRHARSVAMEPNDMLIATPGNVAIQKLADASDAARWREGILVFKDQPLAEAVAELNRYSRHQLVLGDDRARQLRISGSFRTGEVASFVEALELGFPVRVTALPGGDYAIASRIGPASRSTGPQK
ncbi:MAG: hypothetical protein B7Y45_08585 [Sphingomonas sp. 28-66-16]|nr:MAG: hypothetical protein B7Y45_08585 [Sphingomonas sp. 28-66-16]